MYDMIQSCPNDENDRPAGWMETSRESSFWNTVVNEQSLSFVFHTDESISSQQQHQQQRRYNMDGGGGQKKLSSSKGDGGVSDVIASLFVLRGKFVTNVVVAAACVLILLLYSSTEEITQVSSHEMVSGTVLYKTHPPIPAVTVTTSPTTGGMTIPTPNEDQEDTVAPTQKVVAETSSPMASPTSPPPTPLPKANDNNKVQSKNNDEEGDTDGEPDPINVYSKFATVVPLPGVPVPDDEMKKTLLDKYGEWHFWDGEEESRPNENFLTKFPNGDVPNDEFPDGAWQADAEFVNHYLNDAGKLVERAMEAIYAEYGYSSDGMTPEQLAERSKRIFSWYMIDGVNDGSLPGNVRKGKSGEGGFIPKKSHDGLVRRLLHAMMTSDTFTVVLCGHSVAAGAGNSGQQSYVMQFHKVMAPIFARLGVKLVTRNMAQGGLGTIQASLGLQSIYGDEIDLLLWDSGMTEGGTGHIDMVARQGAFGKRVPMFMGLGMNTQLMSDLYDSGMDVGGYLPATSGIPETTSIDQAEQVPYAARYMQCGGAMKEFCKQVPRFCWRCWLDDEKVIPVTPQSNHSSDNNNFHPGWRELQVRGRNLAIMLLRALREAIEVWQQDVQSGPPLDQDLWHITEYYDNIRKSVKNVTNSFCHQQLGAGVPPRVCDVPMRAYTEFTPRNDPHRTSMTSVAKAAPDGTKPKSHLEDILDGFVDPVNPCSILPADAVDVYAIVSNGPAFEGARRLMAQSVRSNTPSLHTKETESVSSTSTTRRKLDTGIVPGNGWTLSGEKIGNCDGTFSSRCYGGQEDGCLLQNYNSARGFLEGDEYSGWLVLDIDSIKEGIIIIKIDPWLVPSDDPIPSDWISPEENSRTRNLRTSYNIRDQDEGMLFEYAINGNVTTVPWKEFQPQLRQLQRTVYLFTVLDEPGFQGENVEVAFRTRNCGRRCRYGISHLYYA